jgi:type IV pilus assembly protein PilA
MRRMMKRAKRGFTLIELMIVVAIVGILAVLAIYGVRKYLANAKTAEARNSVGQIAKNQAAAYEAESMQATVLAAGVSAGLSRALCGSEAASVPAMTAVQGKKYQSQPSDWNVGATATGRPIGFACLKFTMDQPQYYSYGFTSSGTQGIVGNSFTATANGDLNGDGVTFSTFSVTGAIQAGYVLAIAPNMLEVLPEE